MSPADDEPDKPARGKEGPLSFEPGEEQDRLAHRVDPDLAAERAGGERPEVPPPAGPPRPRYGWIVGVLALLIIAYITLNTIRTGSREPGVATGKRMPPFAVPLALSDLHGDANVNPERACKVRGPKVLNICQLGEGSPLVLAFFVTQARGSCRRELDLMNDLRARFPRVAFAAVSIRGDREQLRRLIRRQGWQFPIGYDHFGDVASLYAVVDCPTLTFAYPGLTTKVTSTGYLNRYKLEAQVTSLVSASRARGWKG